MANFSDIPTSLRVTTQLPLDHKRFSVSEAELSNLGTSNNLAFTYYDNLKVFCWAEKSEWVWRQVQPGEENTGLVASDFIYPNGVIYPNPGYENKKYNFFEIVPGVDTQIIAGTNTTVTGTGSNTDPYIINAIVPIPPATELSPLKRADEGNGLGIFLRHRDPAIFASIGRDAFDISYNETPLEVTWGATGIYSFAQGNRVRAIGTNAIGMGNDVVVSGNNTFMTGRSIGGNAIDSFCTGIKNTNNGKMNFVSGINNSVTGSGVNVFGQAATVWTGSVVDFNSEPTKPVFYIGNGDIDNVTNLATFRSDALVVRKNGIVEAPSMTIASITSGIARTLVTKEYIQANSILPYKKFVATLIQTGILAPIYQSGAPLENNIGTFTISRNSTGVYTLTATGLLTLNKTVVFVQDHKDPTKRIVAYSNNSGSQIFIETFSSGVPADNVLIGNAIEIRVYN